MMRIMMSFVLLGFTASTCLGGNYITGSEQQGRVMDFAMNPFVPKIPAVKEISGDPPRIIKRFGTPRKKEEMHNVPDRDPTVTLSYYTFHYEGLVITTSGQESKPGVPNGSWIDRIVLSSPEYKLAGGLQIGKSKKAFLDYLGASGGEQYRSKLVYDAEDFESQGEITSRTLVRVTIEFDKDQRATRIVIEHLTD